MSIWSTVGPAMLPRRSFYSRTIQFSRLSLLLWILILWTFDQTPEKMRQTTLNAGIEMSLLPDLPEEWKLKLRKGSDQKTKRYTPKDDVGNER